MLEENTDPETLRAESPSAPSLEISNALSRVHKQYVGRGPTSARTTIDGDLVVSLLEGGYTQAEQTLEENDSGDVVAAGRLGLQDAMREAMITAVQTILGRGVRSFMSANDLGRNLQVEVFVLDVDQDAG
ncbi:MAG: Na-translocating system protein MpsC family protein [Solirubrobacteraceae bacterium]